jgi:MraZ protein
MFLGEIRQTIDADSGLLLPNQFLGQLVDGMVVTRGFDQNLMVFGPEQWQALANKILLQPLSYYQSRNLRRRLFSGAAVLRLDDNDSILIPQTLRDFAGLVEEVVLNGMYDYFEIWSFQRWQSAHQRIIANSNGSLWEMNGV